MKVAVFATMKKTAASVKLAAAAGAAVRRLRVAKHLEGQVNKMVGFCLSQAQRQAQGGRGLSLAEAGRFVCRWGCGCGRCRLEDEGEVPLEAWAKTTSEFVFALRRLEIAGRKLHGESGKVLVDQLPQAERALETGLANLFSRLCCEIHKHQLDGSVYEWDGKHDCHPALTDVSVSMGTEMAVLVNAFMEGVYAEEAEKIGVSSKRVEAETLHRIRSEQGKSTPLLTEFVDPPGGYPTCISTGFWSDESGEEERDEQFEEELAVQEALMAEATAGNATEDTLEDDTRKAAKEMGCCLLWLNCIWNLLCAVASVGAALVAGVCLVLVFVAEAVWSGSGSFWRGILHAMITLPTTAIVFLFLRSRLAIVELFSAVRKGVAQAEQLCDAATVEENAAGGVVLAKSVSDQADGDEGTDSDEKLPPPSGGVAPNCRGGKASSRAAMRVGGRRRQSAKRQHKTFDPGGSAGDAGAD